MDSCLVRRFDQGTASNIVAAWATMMAEDGSATRSTIEYAVAVGSTTHRTQFVERQQG